MTPLRALRALFPRRQTVHGETRLVARRCSVLSALALAAASTAAFLFAQTKAMATPVARDALSNGDFLSGVAGWTSTASDVSHSGGVVSFHDGDDAAEEACLSQSVSGIQAGHRLSFSVDVSSKDMRTGWSRFVFFRIVQDASGELLGQRFEVVGNEAPATRARLVAQADLSGSVTVSMCLQDNDPSPVLFSRARLLVTGNGSTPSPREQEQVQVGVTSGSCPSDLTIESQREEEGNSVFVREHLVSLSLAASNTKRHSYSETNGHRFQFTLPSAFETCEATVRDEAGRLTGHMKNGQAHIQLAPLAAVPTALGASLVRVDFLKDTPVWEYSVPSPRGK